MRSYLIINEDEQLNSRGAMNSNTTVSSNARIPAPPSGTSNSLILPWLWLCIYRFVVSVINILQLLHTPEIIKIYILKKPNSALNIRLEAFYMHNRQEARI